MEKGLKTSALDVRLLGRHKQKPLELDALADLRNFQHKSSLMRLSMFSPLAIQTMSNCAARSQAKHCTGDKECNVPVNVVDSVKAITDAERSTYYPLPLKTLNNNADDH